MNNSSKPDFRDTQYAFARHIRDPQTHAAPAGIEDRRMGIYRELFYNNIEGFCSSNFPILKSLYTENRWHTMIRQFMVQHQCHTPYFPKFGQEFVDFLKHERDDADDPPFLLELAHHEWVETALALDETTLESFASVEPVDLLNHVPVVSPLAWPLQYRFPVHQIGPDFQPQEPSTQPIYLLIYRNRDDDVGFMETNPVTFRLVQILQTNNGCTGRAALDQIVVEMNHPQPEVVINGGYDTLVQLLQRDIILGTRAP